jgi:aspartate carbamoyltransferase regulatory subunit
VADTFFAQEVINRIAIIAPSAVINTIKDFEVIKKEQVSLPDEVVDLVVCNNPKCITRNEPMKSRFEVIDRDDVTLKCCYCEHEATGDMLSIK